MTFSIPKGVVLDAIERKISEVSEEVENLKKTEKKRLEDKQEEETVDDESPYAAFIKSDVAALDYYDKSLGTLARINAELDLKKLRHTRDLVAAFSDRCIDLSLDEARDLEIAKESDYSKGIINYEAD